MYLKDLRKKEATQEVDTSIKYRQKVQNNK